MSEEQNLAEFTRAVQAPGPMNTAWDPEHPGAGERLACLRVGWLAGRKLEPAKPGRTKAEKIELHRRFREMAAEGVAPEAITSRLGTSMNEMVNIEAELLGTEQEVAPNDLVVGDRVLVLARWWTIKTIRPSSDGLHVHAHDWRGQVLDHRYAPGTKATRWQVSL